MSKLSFRARALDTQKQMGVYIGDDIPESLTDIAVMNRTVPQMPTGMEKEEEAEHHLQKALSAQQIHGTTDTRVIPIPSVMEFEDRYKQAYPTDFRLSKQYIHMQAWSFDQELIDYDMDDDDEIWLKKEGRKFDLADRKFESMMDRLEKASGQLVVSLNEAKMLLKEDDDLTIAVYDYWLAKRLSMQATTLIPHVKTDKRDGTGSSDPYVAFRRRTEKMQTRKNRKNDEASYEKMLKLRRDLKKALTIIELVKRREKSKKELLQLTIEVFEKRYQCEDWSGDLLTEAKKQRIEKRPVFNLAQAYQWPVSWQNAWNDTSTQAPPKKKRRSQKPKRNNHRRSSIERLPQYNDTYDEYTNSADILSEESISSEEDDDPDGLFSFRRKLGSKYLAPVYDPTERFPWTAPEDGGIGDDKFKFSLVSLDDPRPHCVGYVRRRLGRGGRIIFDRARSNWDDLLRKKELSVNDKENEKFNELLKYIKEKQIPHFKCNNRDILSSSSSCQSLITSSNFKLHQEELFLMEQKSKEIFNKSPNCQESNQMNSNMNIIDHDSAKNALAALFDPSKNRTSLLKINLSKKKPAEFVDSTTNCIF